MDLFEPEKIAIQGEHRFPKDCVVVVMEYVDGINLKTILDQKLRKGEVFSWREIEAFVIELAETLAYIHSKGIIHRDLKPENLIVDYNDTGQLKLLKGH